MKRRGGAATVATPRGGRSKRRRGAAAQEEGEASPTSHGDQEQLAASAHALEAVEPSTHYHLDPALVANYAAAAAAHAAAACTAPGQDAGGEDEAGPEGDADEDGDAEGPAPSGPPDISIAATELARLTGISADTAVNALKETQDKVFSENASGDSNSGATGAALLQTWLEEAQIWLACNMEVQEEIEDVRAAMQESLQAYEAAKAADDVPLVERPPDYLRERFLPTAGSSAAAGGAPRSVVFVRLADLACHHVLFAAGGHKAPLVKLADLECKCRRWYPNKGTSRFWERLADECTAAAAAAAPAAPPLKQEGWVSCARGSDACSTCAAAVQHDAGGGVGPSTSAPIPEQAVSPRSSLGPREAAAVLAAVGAFAALKGPEVEREVCKMPTISGQVPDMFARLDDRPGESGGSDADDIVVLEADASKARAPGAHEVDEV